VTRYLPRPDPMIRVGFDFDPAALPRLSSRASMCGLSLSSYLRLVCTLLADYRDPTDETVKTLAAGLRAPPEPKRLRGRPRIKEKQ
jgi:hypothetical protein